jgi:hypothetical protein
VNSIELIAQENIQPRQLTIMQDNFQTQIDRMQAEIQAYDDLKAGKVEIKMGSIEDLPKVLIQKRIA